jgi:hypothetical protein
MSANNQTMAQLHRERLARLNANTIMNQAVPAQAQAAPAQAPAPPFECPVCYTDGSDSGLVSPNCGHKICLECYSTILIRTAAQASCPCCRTNYLKTAPQPVQEEDPYADMPPLMSQIDMEELVSYSLMTRILGAESRAVRHQGLSLINNLLNFADDIIPFMDPDIYPQQQAQPQAQPIQRTMN